MSDCPRGPNIDHDWSRAAKSLKLILVKKSKDKKDKAESIQIEEKVSTFKNSVEKFTLM